MQKSAWSCVDSTHNRSNFTPRLSTRLVWIAQTLGPRAAPTVKRVLVARCGFTTEVRRQARVRGDIELVDLDRLYNGS